MSGAAEAQHALRTATSGALTGIADSMGQVRAAHAATRSDDGFVGMMRAAVAVILASEAVQAAAEEARATTRAALAAAMDGSGCTSLETESHVISLKDTPRRAVITDQAALPPGYLKPREPEVDRAAIRAALLKGEPIAGAELDNGGAPIVSISRRKT